MTEYRLPYAGDSQEPVFRPHINPEPSEDETTLLAVTPLPSERVAAMDPVPELEVAVSVAQARRVAEAFRGAWGEVVSNPTSDGKVVLKSQAAHEINERGILRTLPDEAADSPNSAKDGQPTNPEVKSVMDALPKALGSSAVPILLHGVTNSESTSDTPHLDVLSLGNEMPPETHLTDRVVRKVANTQPAQVIASRHRKDTQAIATLYRRVRGGLRRFTLYR